MRTDIAFAYRFHPIGQGLFCTGTLCTQDQTPIPFHWVFDCGSMAKKVDWISQVSWYRDLVLQNHEINLLCISHFDKDHVAGLGDLLHGKHVDTVVIPYYTPLERLVLGAMQERRRGQDDGDYADFLSNPIAFLIEHAASIRRIIVIHRSPPEDPGWPFGGNMGPDSPLRWLHDRPLNPERHHRGNEHEFKREQWQVKVCESQPSPKPPPFATGLPASLSAWGGELIFVGENCLLHAVPSASLGFCPLWEFLFFHKPESAVDVSKLRGDIDGILKEGAVFAGHHLSLADALCDVGTRKKIKDAYHRVFPGSKRFNTAGVCMYSGPLADKLAQTAISLPCVWHGIPLSLSANGGVELLEHDPYWRGRHGRLAALYSGDADFQPKQHRDELKQFLTDERWQSIKILQVPHHGSEHNWQIGSANEFHHQWSVFSADPQRKPYHPDQTVLLDLLNRNPLLVDRIAGVSWSGWCHFEESPGTDHGVVGIRT